MKKAVMYGAGKIGRAFVGKIFMASGYEVCFLDIVPELIEELENRGEYPVRIVTNDTKETSWVTGVTALNGETAEATEAIAQCDIMAISVGVNSMPDIAPNIARAVKRRMQIKDEPLDVILAENQLGASGLMRDWIYPHLNEEERAWADEKLGLVDCCIGITVPKPTQAERDEDMLLLLASDYAVLPVDGNCFKGEIPKLVWMKIASPFEFYPRRKLFVHNMSHALSAYLAYDMGEMDFCKAAALPQIRGCAKDAMENVAKALDAEYGVDMVEMNEYIEGLLNLYANEAMKETIERVAADPLRKLRKNDRLVGAALYADKWGSDPSSIVKGIAAALRYDAPEDESAVKLQQMIAEKGVEYIIENHMEIPAKSKLAKMIAAEYAKGKASARA